MRDDYAIVRAWDRLAYARRELARFEQSIASGDVKFERSRRKLIEDIEKAERDVRWAENAAGRYEAAFGGI
jgi:hypothetical protein